jgi:uncharacterized protein YbjT (DUF2867 family)
MTVLVTGARGNVGSRVLARLVRLGVPARGSAREAGRADVQLDITDPWNAGPALKDVTAMFLYPTLGPAPDAFLRATREAGVEYVVLLSSPDVYEGPPENPIRLAHVNVERSLDGSGLPHTVLYPGWLASDARRDWGASIRGSGRVAMAQPDAQFTPIHEDDVAEVAAELLVHRGYPGRMLSLTGPESLRQRDIVAVLAEVLGRPLPIDELSREDALRRREPWMPERVLEYLLDNAASAVGRPAPVNNTVERFTGHPARPFRQWALEHRAEFG